MPSNSEWSPSCWDCGRDMAQRNLQPHPVHIHHEDGMGYDRVEVPLCHACRLNRMPTHECEHCGEEYIDITSAAECCQHRRGRPMPDGGHDVEGLAVEQYADAEAMLPFGELLRDIRGTNKAVHVGYYSEDKYDDRGARDHHWIAHMPEYERGSGEFLSVRISTAISGVTHVLFETACEHLEMPEFYSWELAVKEVVPIDRTPIPYRKEPTLSVECPECERFGTTHPWKFDDYVPDTCPCGFGGEWDVRA